MEALSIRLGQATQPDSVQSFLTTALLQTIGMFRISPSLLAQLQECGHAPDFLAFEDVISYGGAEIERRGGRWRR